MKKILATLVTALVLGATGLAVASATTPGSPTTESPSSDAAPKAHTAARRAAFKAAADAIGISPADLLQAMKGGHSMADVAATHDVEVQTVIDAVVAALDARIQQALTDGRITSEQATKLTAAVATRVPKLVNATPKQIRRHRIVRASIYIAAETIGVTPAELRAAIASGKSVSEVATAHDVDPATVVAALVSAGEARLDKAVEAHPRFADRAARLKARLPELAQRFVDFKRSTTNDSSAAPAPAA
jgi:uncharacterized protein (DUF433 family)